MDTRGILSWAKTTQRLLEICESSFEVSLLGLPFLTPCEIRLSGSILRFTDSSQIDGQETEIANAFFLRLKGLIEAQLKLLCEPGRPDWRDGAKLVESIQKSIQQTICITEDDRGRWGELCAMPSPTTTGESIRGPPNAYRL